MPRHARKYYDTSFFHVIVQGINKEYIFKTERYINEYKKLLNKNKEDTSIEILAYSIMNNHAHLLIYANKIEEMSKFMKKVNTSYAKYYNYMENNRVGYVFRDRYLSEPIENEAYLIKCISYIHENPVKAGIVERKQDYRHSSYREYLKGRKTKLIKKLTGIELDDEIIKSNTYMGIFKDIEKENNLEELINGITNMEIEEIKNDDMKLKEIIEILKKDYKINYSDMRKCFGLSRRKLDKLKNVQK